MAEHGKGQDHKDQPRRPLGIPEDYQLIYLKSEDGAPFLLWGRVIETETIDGRKELSIEAIPADE